MHGTGLRAHIQAVPPERVAAYRKWSAESADAGRCTGVLPVYMRLRQLTGPAHRCVISAQPQQLVLATWLALNFFMLENLVNV